MIRIKPVQPLIRELTPREQELILLLWDYLKRDPDHKDRRRTGYGTKTKVGLVNSIAWILDPRRGERGKEETI